MIPKNNDMRIELTTKCNYNCVICPREKITRKIETMSNDMFKMLFDKINSQTEQYDTLTFPGMGEPLLDRDIIEKIKYAKSQKKDISVLMLTNGSMLTPELFKKLEDSGMDSVRVSFYGIDPESYSLVHGVRSKGIFEKVRDNLEEICKIKSRTEVLLTFNVVDGGNAHNLDKWVNFWKDKADLIEVWKPHNWVDGRAYRTVQADKLKTCGRPFNGPLQVQVDGTVNMCCFDYDGKLTIGDLKEQSLSEVFETDFCKKINKCHQTGDFSGSSLICENCDQRNKDKSDVMVYNSKFNIEERVNMTSTTYKKVV